MEKANKKIIYENLTVHNAFINELSQIGDAEYSKHHMQNSDWYRSFTSRFNQILGFEAQTLEEFTTFVSTIDLTPEQKEV